MYKSAIRLMVAALMLAGCARTEIKVDSQIALPTQFEVAQQAQGAAEVGQWWQAWHDPVLSDLIKQGLARNHNLAALRANIQAARANAALAMADLGPNLGLVGGVGAHNVDINNPLSAPARSALLHQGVPLIAPEMVSQDSQRNRGSNLRLGFSAGWEPDIFGAKRSDADAAGYAGLGIAEQWRGAQVLLATDIADNYFKMRALEQRLRIGQNSVAALRQLQRYAVGRFHAGQVTDYDVKEVAAKLDAMKAQLATLQAQADVFRRNIAVLAGRIPQGFTLPPPGVDVLTQIPSPPSGQTPLEVLNRRPDVRAQENTVKAMSAKLASAKADLLPRFDIQFLWQSGRIRLDSSLPAFKGLGGLVSGGVTLPIFTAGRIRRNIDMADARLQSALAQYDQSLLQALADVDNSYQMQYSLNRQSRLLDAATGAAMQQADGAQKLFRYGNITLDRSLSARLNAEKMADEQVQARLAEAQNMLNLYKALGGGWSDDGIVP